MSTFTVDGITYNITDHSAGTGLSEADIERMIRNLHTTDSYSNKVGSLDPADKTINIEIDNQNYDGTVYNGSNSNININSPDFVDGYKPAVPDENWRSMQNTVDFAYAHEVGHFVDAKKNGTPLGHKQCHEGKVINEKIR